MKMVAIGRRGFIGSILGTVIGTVAGVPFLAEAADGLIVGTLPVVSGGCRDDIYYNPSIVKRVAWKTGNDEVIWAPGFSTEVVNETRVEFVSQMVKFTQPLQISGFLFVGEGGQVLYVRNQNYGSLKAGESWQMTYGFDGPNRNKPREKLTWYRN